MTITRITDGVGTSLEFSVITRLAVLIQFDSGRVPITYSGYVACFL